MSDEKLEKALNRLQGILPLQARQAECSREVRELHRQVLRSFVVNGRILGRDEMAQYVTDLDAALAVLKGSGLVVFSGSGEAVGAYPFTMEAREHKVRVGGHQVHAMCALDALAVSSMFGLPTQIDSRCRVTGDRVGIRQSGMAIENPVDAGDVHVGIAWAAAGASSCCADSLCLEMMFLRDGAIARQWLAGDAANREVFTLPEAVDFAARFFVPLVSG